MLFEKALHAALLGVCIGAKKSSYFSTIENGQTLLEYEQKLTEFTIGDGRHVLSVPYCVPRSKTASCLTEIKMEMDKF